MHLSLESEEFINGIEMNNYVIGLLRTYACTFRSMCHVSLSDITTES